ncbi:MAG TPA: CBS domain-containing protein [Nitrososphaerales archaeon]|nr:CBS domain-containing protein [Nitrososphaerales archaeon]
MVQDFMSRNVQTAYSHSNVTQAIKIMVEKNIGSVVVIDSSGPIGVFSERDLLSKVLGKMKRPEDCIIMEVMTGAFTATRPNATLVDAAREMVAKKGRLMVFDDGELAGIVTATDIVREIYKSGESFDFTDCITRKVITVDPKTSVGLAIQHMDEKRVGSVLIRGEGNEEPIGIFTERDMLRKVLSKNLQLTTAVVDLSATPVITANVGIDGKEAARIMTTNKIKRLPLLEGRKLVGIVTARDLVEAFSS